MVDEELKAKAAKKPKRGLIVRTLILLTVCGVAAFALLAAKLYEIQILSDGYYEALALDAQLRETEIVASRGTIYDTNGKILAMSAAVENVFISPYEIDLYEQDEKLIAEGLSTILGVERDLILEKASKKYSQYQIIKLKVESGEAGTVRAFIRENKLKGIYFERAFKRYYPNNSLASQIIGFVGTDHNGLNGLEQRYDSVLTGVSGRSVSLQNAHGVDMLFGEYEDRYDAKDGYDIKLTIDSSIQYYIEKHLEQAIVDYDVLGGAMCIAMNAKTGAILGCANYPNYDLNDFLSIGDKESEKLSVITDEDEYKEAVRAAQYLQWRNRALADTYEPGSVFKILTVAMALEENIATVDSVFNCRGSLDNIPGREHPLHCWRRYGHGQETLREALRQSCNIMCVELGLHLGARTFYKYVDAFGLFDKTGLDNSAEGHSIWWDESVFYDRTNQSQLASATFGQTFKVTPIQMITAVAAVVNGGNLMQPYIVREVTDKAGNIVEATEPTVLRQVVSAETSAVMREMLEEVVSIGTGKNAQVRGYRVGGKTGTSENIEQLAAREEDDTTAKDYLVSFIGFAPADDPEIIVLLLLDTPSNETGIIISGGAMAAPVVGNMLSDILPLCLGITPQYTEDDLKDINIDMPRITGRTVDEAIALISESGFEYTIEGDGDNVTGQLPAQNAYVASGTKIIIYAGEDVPREMATVPQLSGMSYTAAKQALESRGLFIRTTGASKSDSSVRVSVQSISAGNETVCGSIVEVTLIDREISELRN